MANATYVCNKCFKMFKEKQNIGGLSAGKAAIGGVLAGPVGAIVGASMGKTGRNNCCPYCGSYDIRRMG